MKKTLVILLALVMVFAFAATAMAADTQYVPYTDIADQDADVQTAIERLSVLGALKGYNTEGTIYMPANNISREEFATIGVRIAGLEDQVALYASLATAFKDVEEGRWSEGYINCANANGIMIGRGAGIFDPKANVTMQEVVTVLLRAVGYDDRLPGAWPTDYNTKAVKVGIAKYVDFVGPKAATRGEVASMVNEAIGKYVVYYLNNDVAQGIGQGFGWIDQDGFAYRNFGTNEQNYGWQQEPEPSTLLYETFNAYVVPELVFWDENDDFSEASAWFYDDYDNGQIGVWTFTEDLDESGYYEFYLADIYGISGQNDLTDLGYQVGDLTVIDNEHNYNWDYDNDDEVAYINILSTVTRVSDAAKAIDGWVYDHSPIAKEGYGEYWSYEFDNEDYDQNNKVYASKDFSYFDDWGFDIVDSADEDTVSFKYGYYYDIDLEDDYSVFYLMGEDRGFIDAADLEENDVLYYNYLYDYGDGDDDGYVDFYLVFRPVAGELDDYDSDFIKVDGDIYTNVGYSLVSIDSGATVESYTDAYKYSEDILWAPAYSFVDFSYLIDDINNYNFGVLDSYVFQGRDSQTRLNVAVAGQYIVTGINILLPGDDELTTLMFEDKFYASFSACPAVGSLVYLTLNKDGKIESIDEGHNWYYTGGPLYDDGLTGEDVTAKWNSGQTKLTLSAASGDTGFNTVWTFADNAVIYLVETDSLQTSLYGWDSAKCLTLDEFKALGDFSATDASVYDYSGSKISTLYILDIDEQGIQAYGFGLYTEGTGNLGYSSSAGEYYAKIDGEKVLISSGCYSDLQSAGTCLFAYKTKGGVVKSDYVIIEDTDDFSDYYTGGFYDHLDYELAAGTVDKYQSNTLYLYDVVGGASLIDLDEENYTTATFVGGYDFYEDAAANFATMQDNINDYSMTYYALVAYQDANDLFYVLLDDDTFIDD